MPIHSILQDATSSAANRLDWTTESILGLMILGKGKRDAFVPSFGGRNNPHL